MDEVKVKINEIYYTFSGEGATKGFPVVIVRVAGCNLRCSYCDSKYAYVEGEELTFDEIVERIDKYRCFKVLLTGGEPLASPHCLAFVQYLYSKNFSVILETNGSFLIGEYLPYVDMVCLDIKCPASRMAAKMRWENLEFGCVVENVEVKFVISCRTDYDFAKEIIKKYTIDSESCVFSPVWGKIEPKQLAEWMLEDKLGVRYSLQMHKVIWDKDKRGV